MSLLNLFFSQPLYNEDDFILINYSNIPPPLPKTKDISQRHSYPKVKCKFNTFKDYQIFISNKNKLILNKLILNKNQTKSQRKKKKKFRKR